MWKFMALALILAKKAYVFDLLRQHDLLSGDCVWGLSFLWASLASILPSNGELFVCANLCMLELSLGYGSRGIYDGVGGFWFWWWLGGHLEAASHCHCPGGGGLNVWSKQGGKKRVLSEKSMSAPMVVRTTRRNQLHLDQSQGQMTTKQTALWHFKAVFTLI